MSELSSALIDFFNLTGGLNTVNSAIRLKHEEAHDIQDIDFFPIGGISKRNGFLQLNPVAVDTTACTGLYMARFSTSGGTNVAYLISRNKLYNMSGGLGGTWTDITNGQTITYAANNIWNFAILNDIVVLGNNVDTTLQISSSSVATTLGGVPFTSCLFPLEYRGYMCYFNPVVSGTQQYDRFYFSSINDPTVVGTNNFVDVGKKQGGDVRGAVDYKTYLYIFKRHGIYQVNYQPTRVNSAGVVFPFNEFPNPIVPGVGTQSHRSIVKFTTPETHLTPGRELVFFVDQFGIPRIFDGTTTISFASKIGASRDTAITNLSLLDFSRSPYAFSINYPLKSKILCFMSKAGSKQDTCFVFDYSIGFSISRYRYNLAFNVGALFEKSDGTFKPYVGDYAGKVHELDKGTSDNGQPIDAYYITGDSYGRSPVSTSNWPFLEVRGTTGSTSQNVTFSFYKDGEDTPALIDTKSLADTQTTWGTTGAGGTMTWGISNWAKQGLITRTQEINIDSKTMRVKVENPNLNETFALEGWSLAVRHLGTRQQ